MPLVRLCILFGFMRACMIIFKSAMVPFLLPCVAWWCIENLNFGRDTQYFLSQINPCQPRSEITVSFHLSLQSDRHSKHLCFRNFESRGSARIIPSSTRQLALLQGRMEQILLTWGRL